MTSPNDVSSLLSEISSAGSSFAQQASGAREQLLSLTYKLAAAPETPSEVIQRIGWAEVGYLICSLHYLIPLRIFLLIETSIAGKIRRHANGSRSEDF